jgi:ATP-dependent RNA helicase DHX37/DHR1
MLKSWAKLHPQTEVLLKALVEREVASREALLWWWEREPKYLLKAFSLWLPQSRHTQLASMWPPK